MRRRPCFTLMTIIESLASCEAKRSRMRRVNKLEARDLVVQYGQLTAVDGVSFGIPAGGTLGLVGESGSGKSTVARAIVQLASVGRGQILLGGKDVTYAQGANLNEIRSRIQMIFQDPYSSLNPRLSVGAMIDEVLQRHRDLNAAQRRQETGRLLDMAPPGEKSRRESCRRRRFSLRSSR